MIRFNLKQIFIFILLAFMGIACDDGNPTEPEEHIDADGFVLKDENGLEVYKELEGAITGAISLGIGDTLELSVHFLDHEGNEIEHDEEEENEEEEESLQASGNDISIAVVEVEEHEEEAEEDDDHEEEEHGAAIHIIGKSAGTTNFILELMHEGHADYTSLFISVIVE